MTTFVVGRETALTDTRMNTREPRPVGPAHAVRPGQSVAVCGQPVDHLDEQRPFPPSGPGAPPVCGSCKQKAR